MARFQTPAPDPSGLARVSGPGRAALASRCVWNEGRAAPTRTKCAAFPVPRTLWRGEEAARPAQHAACRGTPLHVTAAAAGLLEAPPAALPAVQRSMTRTVSTSRVKPAELDAPHVAYEMVQGALVRWSEVGPYGRPPPTCVLLHGILGSRRNLTSFAHRLVEGFPSWQVLLVDLRCHGESTKMAQRPPRPHGVESAAEDVLTLLGQLKLFPEVLVGHSFGGKVVMSMVEQFGRLGSRLPRPVQVWVLDALPGEVRAGEAERKDHPADLIETLRRTVLPLRSRATLQEQLLQAGFSSHIARWTTTNLRPMNGDPTRGLTWTFDLAGIGEMYASYEATSLWPFLRRPVAGARVSFVRAEGSNYRWAGGDEQRITALGHDVHLLRQAGHWVATDNPDGLFEILAPSFGAVPDLHMQRTSMASPAGSFV